MKTLSLASSILLASCLFLAGCDSLGLPDLTLHDQVPPEVKAQPRIVESAPPLTGNEAWPRLGDVPFKPKDFSPKPVYDHYMNELEYDRAVSEDAKEKVEQEAPALPNVAPPQGSAAMASPAGSAPVSPPAGAAPAPPLSPPQLPKQ